MNILVLGATGMLGHVVFKVLSSDPSLNVFGTVRSEFVKSLLPQNLSGNLISNINVENDLSLKHAFNISKPNVVINCIGIIKQLSDAENVLKTIPINTLLPHRLFVEAMNCKARLILVSTDCVFSGKKGDYLETDFPDCDDVYGRSKLLGEICNAKNVLTIRTSIIGHELRGGHSLVDWFLSQADIAQGYSQAIFSGLPTNELANIIKTIILQFPSLSGLYHVSSNPISKFDLLKLISQIYDKKIMLIQSDMIQINRSLNHLKFYNATSYLPKNWPVLIESMRNFDLDSNIQTVKKRT
jgi:dTDP-4-dehydrorhamnose reductase